MRITALVLPATFILFSCSYLPEEPPDGDLLREDRADFSVYYGVGGVPENAFLMVPGGLVDPHVYACWINRLVSLDPTVAVVLVKYPSNLAIANPGKIMRVIDDLPEFRRWSIGGHSLGGVVAASVASKNATYFDGLVMMAAWSREASDLSQWARPVLSVYASEDQLATPREVLDNSAFLPPGFTIVSPEELEGISGQTAYYEITGGNHSGFGCYGTQKGDGTALIDASEQQERMVDMLISFFGQLW